MGTKHRGITKDTREWVYGDKITVGDRIFITCKTPRELIGIDCSEGLVRLRIDCHEIIPETLGVFTGLESERRKLHLTPEVYEHDIYRIMDRSDKEREYIVIWIKQRAAFYLVLAEHYWVLQGNNCEDEPEFEWLFQDAFLSDFSIDSKSARIGTIHDHLLNEKKGNESN